MNKQENKVIQDVRSWLEQVVIRLNLCPFAKAPYQKKQIRFIVCPEILEEDINQTFIQECNVLDQHPEIETSLIICSNGLSDFFDYQQFLLWAEQSLKKNNWQGTYQIASFHPDYIFANTNVNDKQNLTNRAPYPILHLLRQASLNKALDHYDSPESIPEKNIQTMQSLTSAEMERLFTYLF